MNILSLCTGNSCRSQIAEGWTRHLGGPDVSVESAGIEAHGKNPRAIAIMQEAGIDISTQESTIVDEAMLERADIVVTVCGHADEQCPVLPAGKQSLGTRLDVSHLAATPVGMKVVAEAKLVEVDGRRLVFAVTARDEVDLISEGHHERVVVTAERFEARNAEKAARR